MSSSSCFFLLLPYSSLDTFRQILFTRVLKKQMQLAIVNLEPLH